MMTGSIKGSQKVLDSISSNCSLSSLVITCLSLAQLITSLLPLRPWKMGVKHHSKKMINSETGKWLWKCYSNCFNYGSSLSVKNITMKCKWQQIWTLRINNKILTAHCPSKFTKKLPLNRTDSIWEITYRFDTKADWRIMGMFEV